MDYQNIINEYIAGGAVVVPELEAQEICKQFGILTPPAVLAGDEQECLRAAEAIGYPVVLKIVSLQVIHKSDVGGVVPGIFDAEQLRRAYERLIHSVQDQRPDAVIRGVLVQKQVKKGVEAVVGGLRNAQFGPVVMVGMGGIYVEVLKDVAFRLAPLDCDEALRQIKETKLYQLLQGVRGERPCDINSLCDLIVGTGQMISSIAGITEIDFNPAICSHEGCTVVDARLVLDPALRGETRSKTVVAGK
jgi:succinyl-CoA synthetase beta subunit